MRPDATSPASPIRPRKASLAEQTAPSTEPRNALPVTFVLRRGSDQPAKGSPERAGQFSPCQEAPTRLSDSTTPSTTIQGEHALAEIARRRSTITGPRQRSGRRSSVGDDIASSPPQDHAPLSPLLLPSRNTSTPSSPKSTSTRSLRKSDDESMDDETGSQAIASSGEEEPEAPSAMLDSAPQLIMPSIKMPSRRPFTQRGKNIGRLKILVAGNRGKTTNLLVLCSLTDWKQAWERHLSSNQLCNSAKTSCMWIH